MRKGHVGGVVTGREKIWTLSYTDDINSNYSERAYRKEMIKIVKSYFEKKELNLNVGKSKVLQLVLKKGKGKKNK